MCSWVMGGKGREVYFLGSTSTGESEEDDADEEVSVSSASDDTVRACDGDTRDSIVVVNDKDGTRS